MLLEITQELNARALEAEGAALVIREGPNLISEIRDSFFKLVQDEEAVDGMRQASRKIGKPNAAIHIADDLIEMAKKTGIGKQPAVLVGQMFLHRGENAQ